MHCRRRIYFAPAITLERGGRSPAKAGRRWKGKTLSGFYPPNKMEHKIYKKVVLLIFDGFGVASYTRGNAIAVVDPPTFNSVVVNYPALTLQAAGPLVGLPFGEPGNSEVGHLNIGGGRVVGQDLPRINIAISTGSFFKNKEFLAACDHAKKNNSALHLMGMVSTGGVHSSDEHLFALLNLAQELKVERVFIHLFTDGRDTTPKAAETELVKVNDRIKRIGAGVIATVTGRFYAMDRGGHWSQTIAEYRALTEGIGQQAESPEAVLKQNYDKNIFDEMIPPSVIIKRDENGQPQPIAKILENDAVIFFNFRSDRAIQLARTFVDPAGLPKEFQVQPLRNLYFVTMTEYSQGLSSHIAFPPQELKNCLGEYISNQHLTQFHIAETEKYAHVTSFLNCGRTEPFPGEERLIVQSPANGNNYADQPQMSAPALTDMLIQKITTTDINFFVANFANADMVGHTGNLKAAEAAVRSLDECLQRIVEVVLRIDAVLLVTADHGNIEEMVNAKTGEINTDHTANPVPLIFIANEFKAITPTGRHDFESLASLIPSGMLSDVAPTVLGLLGLPKPPEMTAVNLLELI